MLALRLELALGSQLTETMLTLMDPSQALLLAIAAKATADAKAVEVAAAAAAAASAPSGVDDPIARR